MYVPVKKPIKKPVGLIVLLFFVLALAGPVLGQEALLPMQQLEVGVWPEYDKPQVLVIYNGLLVNNTGEPFAGEVRYRLPQGAQVNMVCELEKGMVCQPYDTVKGENGIEVVWRPSRELQPGETFPVMFEYYYQPVAGPGERNLEFIYQEAFPVEQLKVAVQQPLRAENFQVDPSADYVNQEEVSGQQFAYHNYQFNDVAAGQQLAFQISYQKPDVTPSVTPATTTSPPEQEPQSPSPFNTTVVVILVAFVAILAFFLLYPRRQQKSSSGTGRRSPIDPEGGSGGSKKKGSKAAGTRAAGTPARGASTVDSVQAEKRKIRKMLLDGKISEDTYRQLLAEIEKESR